MADDVVPYLSLKGIGAPYHAIKKKRHARSALRLRNTRHDLAKKWAIYNPFQAVSCYCLHLLKNNKKIRDPSRDKDCTQHNQYRPEDTLWVKTTDTLWGGIWNLNQTLALKNDLFFPIQQKSYVFQISVLAVEPALVSQIATRPNRTGKDCCVDTPDSTERFGFRQP